MQVQFKKMKFVLMVSGILMSSIFAMADGGRDTRPREEVRAAMHECHEAAGISKPEQGQRPQAPSEDQRVVIEACLKEKGIEMPRFGGGPRPDRESASVQ